LHIYINIYIYIYTPIYILYIDKSSSAIIHVPRRYGHFFSRLEAVMTSPREAKKLFWPTMPDSEAPQETMKFPL
jgi:hypothetical protein